MATILFNNLESRGFAISVKNNALFVRPSAKLLAADKDAIATYRDEIVALLLSVIPAPVLREDGSLHISFNSLPKYQHWAGGQSVFRTLDELDAPIASWKLYAERDEDLLREVHTERCKGTIKLSGSCFHCAVCGRWRER